MKKGIIGKKIGMTQIFDEKGKVIPVTVIEAGPCVVTQKKTVRPEAPAGFQAPGRPLQEGRRRPQEDPAGAAAGRHQRPERGRPD